MRKRKTYEQRIAEIKQRQAQLKAKEKEILSLQIARDKRKKTRRLFKIGTVFDKAIGHPVDDDELEHLVQIFKDVYLRNAQEQDKSSNDNTASIAGNTEYTELEHYHNFLMPD